MTITIVLATQRLWWQASMVAAILALYLLTFRLTRCRVETKLHRPCRWRVRGLLGTCDYHVGDKRGLPRLVRGAGFRGLPTFMWPRDNFAGGTVRPEPQPSQVKRGESATAAKARRPGYDWAMMGIGIAGVAVSLGSLVDSLLH